VKEGMMARKAKQIMDALAALVVVVAEEGLRRGVGWLVERWRRRKRR